MCLHQAGKTRPKAHQTTLKSAGGVNSPMNDRKKDAKALFTIKQLRRDAMMTIGSVDRVIMNIGALHEKREQDHVYENSSYPP